MNKKIKLKEIKKIFGSLIAVGGYTVAMVGALIGGAAAAFYGNFDYVLLIPIGGFLIYIGFKI